MARAYLNSLDEQGIWLTDEMTTSRVVRQVDSPLDRYTTFDLCADPCPA